MKKKITKKAKHMHVWKVISEEEQYYCDCVADCKCGKRLTSPDIENILNRYASK